MDNLFILLQKDKKIKRQFEILKCLSNKQIVSVDEMSKSLQIHRATLIRDIENLRLLLPEEVVIKQDFRKGYIIEYPANNTIDYYISLLAKKTLVYEIINGIFIENNLDIIDLASKLYTSESVLLRLITHMNKTLKTYNISISKQRLKFVGNEADIRTFLFTFFRTFMDYYSTETIDDLYKRAYNSTKDGLAYTSLHQNNAKIYLYTVISRIRIIHNHFMNVEKKVLKYITSFDSYDVYRTNYFHNLKQLRLDFSLDDLFVPEEEVVWAFLVSLDCVVYVEDNDIAANQNELYRKDFEDEKCIEVSSYIYSAMLNSFNLKSINANEFKLIKAYLINSSLLSKVSFNFLKVSIPLKQYIKDNYKDIYEKWYSILHEAPVDIFAYKYIDDVALTLTMLSIPILKNQSKGSINILFSFEAETGYSAILVDATQQLLVSNVNALYAFSTALTAKFIADNNIDIVVTNYKHRNEDKLNVEILQLSYLPTLNEWSILKNKILSLLR
ncbi:helix-turn-helix domain-containing protein [Mycoplasma sp. P36-A1]|uniref:helix-turn-helix domain-containing protein n=1 Tax=Mycoplasma sp. P36-A1 TaxID=3252900 RepID=UPI003C2F8369